VSQTTYLKDVHTLEEQYGKVVDYELNSLLHYLTRDVTLRGCFTVRLEAENLAAKIAQENHTKITPTLLPDLVAQHSLLRGLAVRLRGVDMQVVAEEDSSK